MVNVNCQSENLIYLITCTTCKVQYVGQTRNRLMIRFQGHFHDIKTNSDTTVARHFNKCHNTENGQPSQYFGTELYSPTTSHSGGTAHPRHRGKTMDAPFGWDPSTGFKSSRLNTSGFPYPTTPFQIICLN